MTDNQFGVFLGTVGIEVTVVDNVISGHEGTGLNLDLSTNSSLSEEGISGNIITRNNSGSKGQVLIETPRSTATTVPPRFIVEPTDVLVEFGGQADFYAAAVGSEPIDYQWFFNRQPIDRGTNHVHRVRLARESLAGNYTVVASNNFGSVTGQVARLILNVPATAPLITRHQQSQTLTAGQSLTLDVQATGTAPLQYQWCKNGTAVAGAISATLTIASAQSGDSGDYTVTVGNSADTRTSQVASVLVEGGTSGGGGSHPADTNSDFRIAIGEVTAYGAAWKRGDTWPVDPNPIPIGYLTRAGALWKGGETYRVDSSIADPPLWWVNETGNIGLQSVGSSGGTAVRTVSGVNVSLEIQPASSTGVNAVEESLPTGFTANAITGNGAFDANSSKIKWGPFFDNSSRDLSYVLTGPASFSGTLTFTGTASFDGADLVIAGDTEVSSGAPSNVEAPTLLLQQFSGLWISGTVGATYVIESTGNVGAGPWVEVQRVVLENSPQLWVDLESPDNLERFYRARAATQ